MAACEGMRLIMDGTEVHSGAGETRKNQKNYDERSVEVRISLGRCDQSLWHNKAMSPSGCINTWVIPQLHKSMRIQLSGAAFKIRVIK